MCVNVDFVFFYEMHKFDNVPWSYNLIFVSSGDVLQGMKHPI